MASKSAIERFASFVARNRRASVPALVSLTLLAAWPATQLRFDFSFKNLFATESSQQDPLSTLLDERFASTGGSYLLAILRVDDVFRPEVLVAIDKISFDVSKIPNVERVISLATIPFIYRDPLSEPVRPITQLVAAGENAEQLGHLMVASPLYVRRIVSPSRDVTPVIALLDNSHRDISERRLTLRAFKRAVETTIRNIEGQTPNKVSVMYTGYPEAEAEMARLVWRGFSTAEFSATLLMAIALYLCFRSIVGVIVPLVCVGVTTVVTLALVHLTGQSVTLTNSAVPLLLLVIGISETSFLVARYYEEAANGGDPQQVLARAIAAVLKPAFIAAATTSAGFACLMAGRIPATRELGLNVAFGVLFAFLLMILVTPGLILRFGQPPQRAISSVKSGIATQLLSWIAAFNLRHRYLPVLAGSVLLTIGVIGARRIVVEQYATLEHRPSNPIRKAQEVVDSSLMGAFQTQVVLQPRDGDSVARPAVLQQISALQRFLANQPYVVSAQTIVDYLEEINHVIDGNQSGDEARIVPREPQVIDLYLKSLSADRTSSAVSDLIDPDYKVASVMLGTTDLGTGQLLELAARTQRFLREELDGSLEARFRGDYWLISKGANSLVSDLFVTTLTSFVMVFALVGLLLRSWKLMLLSIPPNVVPLAIALAIMGFADIPLRVGTSIILPACLGIAVDSTVHYLARFQEELSVLRDPDLATRRALLGTGRGMLFSGSVLIVGFLCFLVPELRVYNHVGVLASSVMFTALAADLFITPTLALIFKSSLYTPPSSSLP